MAKVNICPEWKALLQEEFDKRYFEDLISFVKKEYREQNVYPPGANIFAAFNFVLPSDIKVVILGQDPYHGKGQANGFSFSVSQGVKNPPSLQNIFKEIESDLGIAPTDNGDLTRWAKQGVFLLNATLTVRAGNPGSHQKKGWEEFTDKVIEKISDNQEGIVFMLWGKFAQSKEILIDSSKHLILKAAHPSPFSAYRGFFGCKHFSKANTYLKSHSKKIIEW